MAYFLVFSLLLFYAKISTVTCFTITGICDPRSHTTPSNFLQNDGCAAACAMAYACAVYSDKFPEDNCDVADCVCETSCLCPMQLCNDCWVASNLFNTSVDQALVKAVPKQLGFCANDVGEVPGEECKLFQSESYVPTATFPPQVFASVFNASINGNYIVSGTAFPTIECYGTWDGVSVTTIQKFNTFTHTGTYTITEADFTTSIGISVNTQYGYSFTAPAYSTHATNTYTTTLIQYERSIITTATGADVVPTATVSMSTLTNTINTSNFSGSSTSQNYPSSISTTSIQTHSTYVLTSMSASITSARPSASTKYQVNLQMLYGVVIIISSLICYFE